MQDKEAFIRATLYDYNYDKTSALPTLYQWPEEVQKPFHWGTPREELTMDNIDQYCRIQINMLNIK